MPNSWAPVIRALWLSAAGAWALAGQSLVEPVAREYVRNPSPASRAALAQFAAQHPQDQEGVLARLALGVGDVQSGRFGEAIAPLRTVEAKLPAIADHVAYHLARALFETKDDAGVVAAASRVWAFAGRSPLVGRTAVLAARSLTRSGQAKAAGELLRRYAAELPQPAGDAALAEALEAAGDLVNAAKSYQRIYYESPLAKEAADALLGLNRLRDQLGASYPPAGAALMLGRAQKLLEGRAAAAAKREYELVAGQSSGAERERAQVGLGAALIQAGDFAAAQRYLKSLEVAGEADAERLSLLVLAARRLDQIPEIEASLALLAARYPASKFRLDALTNAGQFYFVRAEPAAYESVYRQCAQGFNGDPRTALCHWRLALAAQLLGRREAPQLLREHVKLYPGEDHVPAAMYLLGRQAEDQQDWPTARAWYREVAANYPNFYYAVLSRGRLEEVRVKGAGDSAGVRQFLAAIPFPPRARTESFDPTPATRQRLVRGRLLLSAGLDAWAEIELRYGARTDSQGPLLALEMAASATRRGAPEQALRYIKALAPGYLMLPLESAPREFWKYAFPLPYRTELERFARNESVDPFLLAGLIRQESEFDARVVSRSNAYGLMQILPGTGRDLSRRVKLPAFSPQLLFNPVVNLQLGTFYTRYLFNRFEKWEHALASYNAGPNRVQSWLNASTRPYRDMAEWVESIPFDETRGYVQSVLRNADTYRRLYADHPNESTPVKYMPPPAPPPVKKAVAGKKPPVKRKK
jgi:soluble lytic murein transglycosylase